MSFPRISSLVLAVGGSVWAFLLLWYTFGYLHYTAGGAFFWLLIWLPGFFAWYGYIRRAFGHFLCRRALITWLVSMVANGWSFFFMWAYFGRGSVGDLPVIVCVALSWIFLAIVLSIACLIQEGRVRESKPKAVTEVGENEFKRLLDMHRKGDG